MAKMNRSLDPDVAQLKAILTSHSFLSPKSENLSTRHRSRSRRPQTPTRPHRLCRRPGSPRNRRRRRAPFPRLRILGSQRRSQKDQVVFQIHACEEYRSRYRGSFTIAGTTINYTYTSGSNQRATMASRSSTVTVSTNANGISRAFRPQATSPPMRPLAAAPRTGFPR